MGKAVTVMNKKKIIFLLAFCSILNIALSQTAVTIYTPKGSVVPDTYLNPELSSSQIVAFNNYVATNYPNATRLTDASSTYNCHGYAWHITEGGSNVWIGYNTSTAEDIYWNDGSYMEICSQQYPAKVSYASDNHSAVTTSTIDIFRSKWGDYPVMQHEKSYTPYNSSVLKYYIRPTINGPEVFCSSDTYSIPNLPAGATVSWSATGSISVPSGSTGSSVIASSNGSGTGILTALVSNACGSVTLSKSITTGFVIPAIQHEAGTNTICAGSINNYFSIAEVAGATYYNWSVYPVPASYNIDGNGTRYITFGTNNPGTYALRLAVTTACGTANANELSLTVLNSNDPNCGSFGSFIIYPNPAGDELTVINTDDSMQSSLADRSGIETGSYHLKLYDDKGKVLAAVKSNGKNKETKINTRDIPNGNYFLHITEGRNIIKKQVIIQH